MVRSTRENGRAIARKMKVMYLPVGFTAVACLVGLCPRRRKQEETG
jgi:hypothetical protein